MSKQRVILAYYQDPTSFTGVLPKLRKNQFRRVSVLRKTAQGALRIESSPPSVSSRASLILWAMAGFTAGYLLILLTHSHVSAFAHRIDWIAMALLMLAGLCLGWLGSRWSARGVEQYYINRYRSTVSRDEILLMVQARSNDLDRVLALLLHEEVTDPVTFVVRPPETVDPRQPDRPFHRESLSVERLNQHAEGLARRQQIAGSRTPGWSLLKCIRETEKVIQTIHQSLSEAVHLKQSVSLSGEWLLDNAYVIEMQITQVRRNLTRGFYKVLPQLQSGPNKGEPRVYALALELVTHTDAQLDERNIVEFLNAYQRVSPLTLGELWAMPLMLRLALLEYLRQLSLDVYKRHYERELADLWANRLVVAARRDPDQVLVFLAEIAQRQEIPTSYFAVQLIRQLSDEESALGPTRAWLERKLTSPLSEIVQQEQSRRTAEQFSIANTIGSMRRLSLLDWRDLFEITSVVEKILRTDPSKIYPRMDFTTRDSYRHSVEEIARSSRQSEIHVAEQSVLLASALQFEESLADVSPSLIRSHVGYFLVGEGRAELESSVGHRVSRVERISRSIKRHPTLHYLSSIAVWTAFFLTLFAALAIRSGVTGYHLLLLAVLALIPLSEVAIQIINYMASNLIPSRALPKMSFEEGIPDAYRTLVVVPMMLLSRGSVEAEVSRLEIRYLANPETNLLFGLFADFSDAPQQHMDGDQELLQAAVNGIEALRTKYNPDHFFLFHRERRFNEGEGQWIGWERKRGKIEELNRFLCGDESRASMLPVGNREMLRGVRFVITLDADTQLPTSRARYMIETLAHPLNHPRLAPDGETVRQGYAVIQPRVSASLWGAAPSRFTRLFSDPTGTDPYMHPVSDLYQDLFGEGIYHGKAIYDLRIFDQVLAERFPDSTLLSHDLLEGAYVRAGLASDIELFDTFPANYLSFCRRQHRWIRGDWQIFDWILPTVPHKTKGRTRNPLSAINRWKIFDNLRRSLIEPTVLALLVASWLLAPAAGALCAAMVALLLLQPVLIRLVEKVRAMARYLLEPDVAPLTWHEFTKPLATACIRALIQACLLPHQASLSADAIARVWYRRLVSRHHLLQWETAQAAHRRSLKEQSRFLLRMSLVTVFALILSFLIYLYSPQALPGAVAFLLAWAASPLAVRWIDAPPRVADRQLLREPDWNFLRSVARRTWRYFQDFVTEESHWLPPDNYQESLRIELAHRTSPTNIGLGLLSTLAARDFGYITTPDLFERTLQTLETVERVEKYQGHLLNWYNTKTLEPLYPKYVSTVDSGNLLACLWTLEQGWNELLDQPLCGPEVLMGLSDTLFILKDELGQHLPAVAASNGPVVAPDRAKPVKTASTTAPGSTRDIPGIIPARPGESQDARSAAGGDPKVKLGGIFASLEALFSSRPTGLPELLKILKDASQPVSELLNDLHQHEMRALDRAELPIGDGVPEYLYWADQLKRQLDGWLSLADRYLSWIPMLASKNEQELLPLGEAYVQWRAAVLSSPLSLRALASGSSGALSSAEAFEAEISHLNLPPELRLWLEEVTETSRRAASLAAETLAQAESLLEQVQKLGEEMNMNFLYNPERRLFSIGYNVSDHREDQSYYDLFASEARLTSFVAIARGDVPVDHWWAMSRVFGSLNGQAALLSWGGTMFEYLMPLLMTRSYEGSLLDQACRIAVAKQIDYARRLGIPWGISEAAFAALDTSRIYQYRAFGVPGLGLKRGLEEDTVVAPYASALAVMVEPAAAVKNLRRMKSHGMLGRYGYYESIDYTRQRVREGERGVIIHAYMAHHEGMTLVALDNALHGGVMQTRFHRLPRVRAAEHLLCESIPLAPPRLEASVPDGLAPRVLPISVAPPIERFYSPDTPIPRVHLLSNGSYSVMVTNGGGGYSRWREIDLTRWRPDTTRDCWGSFCYIRDSELGAVWSNTHQPMRRAARDSTVVFTAERAEFKRRDRDIDTLTEIAVSPEDDAEIRRLTLTNHSQRERRLQLTTYSELALAPHSADRAHPAFSKMFIVTESLPDRSALIATRRIRAKDEKPVWIGQVLAHDRDIVDFQYETDRARFIGRCRALESPAAIQTDLSGVTGCVLDPIFSLRCNISISPGERTQVSYVTVAAETRERVLELIEKYSDHRAAQRGLEMAWSHAQLELRQLRIQLEEGKHFQQLAGHLLYPNAQLRPPAERLRQNIFGQARLWAYGISGDYPIIVVTIGDTQDTDLIREVLVAHDYLWVRGLKADLVILDEEKDSYTQPLMEQLRKMVHAHSQYTSLDVPGGVFLRSADQIPEQDLTLLLAVARVVLVAARGTLAQQLTSSVTTLKQPPPLVISQRWEEEPSAPLPFMELPYFNGLGGFTGDGKEYAIYLGPGDRTPSPWVNVIANPNFGTLVSDSGQGFCWNGNSQSNRLLPWSNDPVSDSVSEAIYIRDEDSGIFWTPTPLPIRELDAYRIRHGQGYTVFEHNSHAIEQELAVFVPVEDDSGPPLRVQRLRLRNHSSRRRRLSVTYYGEWVLGTDREETQLHVSTTWDSEGRALLARNAYHRDYGSRVAFVSCWPAPSSVSGDRTGFLGRNGSTVRPVAMDRRDLSWRTGPGLDPCAALQVKVEIDPGQELDVIFVLGQAPTTAEARSLARQFADPAMVERSLQSTQQWWDRMLGTIHVETPDLSTNFLLNRWLLYQTLSCRLWARSAFYQSGGAFGFRDQLQDVLGLVYTAPAIARSHIIRAASHQFVEGDVQHWWHPPSDAGVRTRISDDLLWLPWVTAHYVKITGDQEILNTIISFLEGRPLEPHEHEVFLSPLRSLEEASLLEHCRRAIRKGLTAGPHGLPLIGAGDWNDGMNQVGIEGKGESVWLAWFIADVLREFADLLHLRGEELEADECRERAARIVEAVENEAWDGNWYRRAYFDGGTPLGSQQNEEAKIDSIAQSWAVLSGAADPARAAQALEAADEILVRRAERLVLLFTPPFNKSADNPGYIKSYPPGVRENGGQYTHAAIWLASAFARRHDGDKAVEILNLLNPVLRCRNRKEVEIYKVEPYILAADVYSLEHQVGRGGWTWYTGSSGWMYRVWLEDVLGFKLRGKFLHINPCIAREWDGYSLHYRYGGSRYHIHVENPDHVVRGVEWIELDGQRSEDQPVLLQDDGTDHTIRVKLGR